MGGLTAWMSTSVAGEKVIISVDQRSNSSGSTFASPPSLARRIFCFKTEVSVVPSAEKARNGAAGMNCSHGGSSNSCTGLPVAASQTLSTRSPAAIAAAFPPSGDRAICSQCCGGFSMPTRNLPVSTSQTPTAEGLW